MSVDHEDVAVRGRLIAAVDVVEIEQLVLAEREAHTRGWWRQMADCYHDDAEVRLEWFRGPAREFVEFSRMLAARDVLPVMSCGPVVVNLNEARAVASASATLTLPTSSDLELTVHLGLLFQVEQRHAAWRIVSLRSVPQREVLAPRVPAPRAPIDDSGPQALPDFARYCREQGIWVGTEDAEDVGHLDAAEVVYAEVLSWADLAL